MKKILILYFVFHSLSVFSQSTNIDDSYKNQIKYWLYRDRFFGDGTAENPGFIITEDADCPSGDCSGYNMIFTNRNAYDNSFSLAGDLENCGYRSDVLNSDGTPIDNSRDVGLVAYPDQTIAMGVYFSVLATEWALLTQNGRSTIDTERKIYLAIKAFNRLDLNAEIRYDKPPVLDGFFVRDDVLFDLLEPSDTWLIQNGMHVYTNIDGTANDNTVDRLGPNFNMVTMCNDEFDSEGCYENHNAEVKLINAMSQDQVISLFMGFRMMTRFVSDNVVYNDPITGESMNLNSEIRAITNRIIYYIAGPGGIKDPNGESVCRGGNTSALWAPMVRAAGLITGDNYPIFWVTPLNLIGWDFAKSSLGISNDNNASMVFKLQAITNDYFRKEKFCKHLDKHDYEIYDLMNSVLYNNESIFGRNYYETYLNYAPCTGPTFFGLSDEFYQDCLDNCNLPLWECHCGAENLSLEELQNDYYMGGRGANFSLNDSENLTFDIITHYTAYHISQGLTEHNEAYGWFRDAINNGHKRFDGSPHKDQQGEHNGLDYMLWYNLFHLYFENLSIDYYDHNASLNLLSEYPSYLFPNLPNFNYCIGCIGDPITYYSFNNDVYVSDLVVNEAGVSVIAPASILFEDNGVVGEDIHVSFDADFLAKIDETIQCQSDGDINKQDVLIRDFFPKEEMLEIDTVVEKDIINYKKADIRVYPNPTNNILNLSIEVDVEQYGIVKMFNNLGQIVYSFNASLSPGINNSVINVSSLSTGIYFVEIQLAAGKTTQLVAVK